MPELEFETGRMNLTEDQEAQIAKEAREEIMGVKKPEVKDEKPNEVKQPDDKAEETKETDKEDDKAEGEVEKPDAEVKKEEPVKDEAAVKRRSLVEEYAKRESISLEQATEEVAKNEAVIKKYGDDPIKLAAALRKAQSEFDKTRTDLEKTKQQASAPKLNDFASVRSYVDKAIAQQKDKLVEMYRAEYPGLSASLDDDAVVDLMRKEATEKMMVRVEENRLTQVRSAGDKRQKLLASFAEDDKAFLETIKPVLDATPDNVVLDEKYSTEDLLRWARGDKNRIAAMIKEAREEGYKRGKEEPRIVGEKNPTKVGGKTGTGTGTTSSFEGKLTASQREIAENKFEGMNMTKEEKYKFYYETYLKK